MAFNIRKFSFIPISAIFLLLFIVVPEAHATTFTWNGGGADDNLSTGGNWVGGVAPTGVSGDALIFTGSTRPTPNNDIVAGTFTSVSITATGFKLKGNAFTLDGGSSAISNTVGTSTISTNITFSVAAPTIAVSNPSGLDITGTIDNGGLAITADVSGVLGISGVISGTGAMTKISAGILTLSGANTFSGGLTVKQGTFFFGVSNATTVSGAAGPSTVGITLGASDGGTASIMGTTTASVTLSNAITLGSSAAGTLSIGRANPSSPVVPTFSGAIALNGNDLILSTQGTSGAITFSGGVTGTGNLTIYNGGSSGSTFTISTASVNNVGTITVSSSSTSSGTVTISGGVGANVTAITDNSGSSASPLTISTTALTVNSSGTTITTIGKIITISGGTTGTGNLTLNNNGTVADAITISGTSANHTGTITSSGTGTGETLISAVIGTNVTGVTQNSSTSVLKLSGANTFTGGTTVQCGTFLVGVSNVTTVSGAAGPSTTTITLGSSSGCAATIQSGSFTISNPITLGSSAVGSTTLANIASAAPTFSGAIALNGNNLTVLHGGISTVTLSGGITGTGNVYLNTGSVAASNNITVSTNPINNVGFVVVTGSVDGTVILSGGIGANVTSVKLSNTLDVLTISGALTVNSSGTTLTRASGGTPSRGLTLSGGTTGTGSLILNNVSTLSGGVTVTTTAINHTGTITNSGSNTGTVTITGGVGANVTAITENSTTSALTISTNAITVNSSGTTLTNTAGTKILTVSGGTTGTGNLIINNNSSLNNGISITTTSANNTGTITNSGSGSGSPSVLISAVIGTNVTGVTQNSSTSSLLLSGANTFTGGVTIKSGTVIAFVSNATTVSGAAGPSTIPITLGASDGASATLLGGTFTISNPINLASGAVGTLSIGPSPASSFSPTFTGAIALNGNNLTLTSASVGVDLAFNGDITGTGNLTVTNAGATGSTIALNGSSINNVGTMTVNNSSTGAVTVGAVIGTNVTSFRNTSSAGGALNINSSNTFATFQDNDGTIAHAITFGAGTTQTVTTWTVSGASGAAVTLQSSAGGSPWNLTSPTSGSLTSDYLVLSDSAAAGTPLWVAGTHSTNGGNNSGWSFTGAPSKLYFSSGPFPADYGSVMSPFTVSVLDDSNNVVTNAAHSITLSIGANPNSGTLSGTLTKAASAGIATFNDLSIDKSGQGYTLLASASGLTGAASNGFGITNPSQGGGGGSSGSSYSPPAATLPTVPPTSSAQATLENLVQQLQELQAKIAEQTPGTTPGAIIPHEGAPGIVISQVSRPLTVGGRGNDVESLQNFLISRGVGAAAKQLQSVGSTAYFGSLTKAALAEFQKSVGISPAVGYFGPITKAYLKKIGY